MAPATLAPPASPVPPDTSSFATMSLGDHFGELRVRVIRGLLAIALGAALALWQGSAIFEVLVSPLAQQLDAAGLPVLLQQLDPAEGVVVYLRTCVLTGAIFAAPYAIWQLWQFVAAGLYDHEQRYVRVMAPLSLALFVAGAAFFYFVALPVALAFLINFSRVIPLPKLVTGQAALTTQPAATWLEIRDHPPAQAELTEGRVWFETHTRLLRLVGPGGQVYSAWLTRQSEQHMVAPSFRLSEYLDFVTMLTLAFGLAFQVPIVVLFSVLIGLVTTATLRQWRKVEVLAVCVVAAIMTPTTDPLNMALLAVPMLALYELGLLLADAMRRPSQQGVRG